MFNFRVLKWLRFATLKDSWSIRVMLKKTNKVDKQMIISQLVVFRYKIKEMEIKWRI